MAQMQWVRQKLSNVFVGLANPVRLPPLLRFPLLLVVVTNHCRRVVAVSFAVSIAHFIGQQQLTKVDLLSARTWKRRTELMELDYA